MKQYFSDRLPIILSIETEQMRKAICNIILPIDDSLIELGLLGKEHLQFNSFFKDHHINSEFTYLVSRTCHVDQMELMTWIDLLRT
jgi:hypothetical protein